MGSIEHASDFMTSSNNSNPVKAGTRTRIVHNEKERSKEQEYASDNDDLDENKDINFGGGNSLDSKDTFQHLGDTDQTKKKQTAQEQTRETEMSSDGPERINPAENHTESRVNVLKHH